ncbi:DUF2339 domain-containing protein [Chitinimonas naiadis]
MAWVGLFVGMLLGGTLGHESGWLLGALVGWLLVRERQQTALLDRLKARLEAPQASPATPAPRQAEPAVVVEPVTQAAPLTSPDAAKLTLPDTPPPLPEAPAEPAPILPLPLPHPPQQEPEPVRPRTPVSPTWLTRAGQWLLQGNPAVKVGVLLLIMGAAFLLKYAAQYVRFPVESRYLALLAGAGVAITFGWRKRQAKPVFAHALQGGGLGIAFLVVFAAFRLHGLLPAGAAFALLAGLAVFSAALALTQSAQSLAIIGLAGGFLAPILASTGQGSHVVLFSYYAILNLGIAYVAHARAWRGLNLLGFLFTFVIATAWGVLRYQASQFASTEPFLIGFWLLYIGLAVAFARRRQEEAGLGQLVRDPVDATLVFGVPLVGFGLQAVLVQQYPDGDAWSATGMAVVYGLLWQALRRQAGLTLLAQAFCVLMVGFATLAIPLAGGAHWTAASWALEGAGLVWLGSRQQRRLSRGSGYLLILIAGWIALFQLGELPRASHWLNGSLLGGVMVAIAAWLAASIRAREQGPLHIPLLLWGLLLWLASSLASIEQFTDPRWQIAAAVGLLAGSSVLLQGLARALQWPAARLPTLALAPALGGVLLLASASQLTPLQDAGWLAWPLASLAWWLALRLNEQDLPRAGRRLAHLSGLWLWTGLLTWIAADASSRIGTGSAWIWLGGMLAPALILSVLARPRLLLDWPLRRYRRDYGWHGPALIALLSWPALLIAPWASTGDATPLPWLPLLNPLDLAWLAMMASLLLWLTGFYPAARLTHQRRPVIAALSLAGFGWLNAMLAHGFHHWGGLPFDAGALWRSQDYHAALSLLWTTIALLTMLLANRRGWRSLWLLGAGLIGITVLKLFLIDLASAGGLARIVSFIGVGLLLVAVGWFAPVPPGQQTHAPEP